MDVAPQRDASAAFLDEIARERQEYDLPPRLHALGETIVHRTLELLFPHFAAEVGGGREGDIAVEVAALRDLLLDALKLPCVHCRAPEEVAATFLEALPEIREALLLDARALYEGDPAAQSVDEVIIAYPGFLAIAVHRVAHRLHASNVPLVPRVLAEIAHRDTGIDIHPGAQIGPYVAIDHGTGIVIGETAVLGAHVKLYQGVTLGALSVEKHMARTKRHPTIGDHVVIYANATILGGETVIGDRSRIGGNVWLTESVPANSIVTPTARIERRQAAERQEPVDFSI